ncbi:MAG: HypC/HybG/HupF family hydrogenase formation chaperone [Pseudomonadota bacterium]|uniref:HypC/HybG/HupF family hydrogenase formation chaperone n=1 Tax=Candidatus Desulfatibia profunda TaxID=2841695 RepID=A0A8J6TN13_9BACT|nr:HypC/HybG/HupF family hydrogenase formation chaperone [Candidatus Desulfatibia profunda]MBL7181271.1 HypC/HybG/HupF family hydrogenase formation chaperone [Desulfobacterales bacterium]MBU0699324.1 HypC/HybG/HupF family hydrogenase formation chaperone [Pseudomonadota bacterium]
MCLAIPSKIVKIENLTATIDVDGVQREASLMLLEAPRVGDYVIVHAGFAIHKINENDALESLKLIRETVSLMFGDQEEGTDSD